MQFVCSESHSQEPHSPPGSGTKHGALAEVELVSRFESVRLDLVRDEQLVDGKIDAVAVSLTRECRALTLVDASHAIRAVDLFYRVERSRVSPVLLRLEANTDMFDGTGRDGVADSGDRSGEVILRRSERFRVSVAVRSVA